MYLTLFGLLPIVYFQTISCQELLISPNRGFEKSILEILSTPRNLRQNNLYTKDIILPIPKCGCGRRRNIKSLNKVVCPCQKKVNVLPGYNNNSARCGCQRTRCSCQKGKLIPLNNSCTCQRQVNLLPNNNAGCRCQKKFIPPYYSVVRGQPNAVKNCNCGCQRQDNLMPIIIQNTQPKTCGCDILQIQGQNNLLTPNVIECNCNKQNIVPNTKICNSQSQQVIYPLQTPIISNQIPSLPNELYLSNAYPITNSPIDELTNDMNGEKDSQRWAKLFNLNNRLAEIADLTMATANLLSNLPAINDVVPYADSEIMSLTDLPVIGNDEYLLNVNPCNFQS